MNKAELIDAITDTVGDRRTATAAVDAVLAVIQRSVAAGDKVAVPGFGVFEKADRAARTARNPATGAAVELEATSVPRFRPGQRFREVVRGDAEPPELPAAAPLPTPRPAARATTHVAPPAVTPELATLAPPAADPLAGVAVPAVAATAVTEDKTSPSEKASSKKPTSKKPESKKPDSKKAESQKPDSKKAESKGGKKSRKK